MVEVKRICEAHVDLFRAIPACIFLLNKLPLGYRYKDGDTRQSCFRGSVLLQVAILAPSPQFPEAFC